MGTQLELPNVDPPMERVKTAARRYCDRKVDEVFGRRPFYISEAFWNQLRGKVAGRLFGAFMLGFQVALRNADVDGITYGKE